MSKRAPASAAGAEDVLAPLPPERRLTLVFERISAFVSVHAVPQSLSARLGASLARRARAGRRAADSGGGKGKGGKDGNGDIEAPPSSTQQRRPSLDLPSSSLPNPPAEHRQILHAVTGAVLPGEVLVLMGPSGSGKTSLLSVVSGRAARAVRTQGRVTVNGERFTKAAKRRVGFVLQDDMLFETLTVQETLAFAAELRLPRATTPAQRAARVEGVISALGLQKCRGTIIGGWERRGISGGERKRVSIGHELLIDPALILLDEPTSGLDATTALHLARTLRRLASGGRAVCSTLHQPSSRIFQQLDRLMLLADGHVLYYGAAAAVVPWFSALGFPCPFGVNVADFILDLAQGEVALVKGASAAAVGGNGATTTGELSSSSGRLIQAAPEGGGVAGGSGHGSGSNSSAQPTASGTSGEEVTTDSGDSDDDDDEDSGGDDLMALPGDAHDKPGGVLVKRKGSRSSASSEGPLRGPAAVAALWRTYERHAAAAAKSARAAAAAASAAAAAAAVGNGGGGGGGGGGGAAAARPPVIYRGFGGERAVLESLRLADGGPCDDAGEGAAAASAKSELLQQRQQAEEDAAAVAANGNGNGNGNGAAANAKKGVSFSAAQPAAIEAANGNGSFAATANPAAGGRSRSFLASVMQRAGGGGGWANDAAADDEGPEFRREISRAFSRGPSQLFSSGPGAAASSSTTGTPNTLTHRRPSPVDRARLALGLQDRGNATYFQQMRVLAVRAARVRRFESLGSQRFVTIAGVAVVTGLCWWQRGRSDLVSGAGDVLGLLFFVILFPSFSSLFAALFAFPAEYGMLCKERQSGMYRVSAYFFSRALVDLPLETLFPSLFVIACYWMGWLRPEAWAFFAHWAAMLLVVLVAQSTGLLLGAVFMDAKKAQTTATILMLCWMLCGGYYVRYIPPFFSWLKYTSFVHWGFCLLIKINYRGVSLYKCEGGALGGGISGDGTTAPPPPPPTNGALASTGTAALARAAGATCVPVPSGEPLQAALGLPADPDAPPWDAAVLVGMLVLLRWGVYVVLRRRTKSM